MNLKMLQSNTVNHRENTNSISQNIHSISINVVSEVQKDLEPCDMISLVFLLYDVPDTALQRLIVYQRICKDIGSTNTDLLCHWALHAQSRPSWRYEFLEALTICQLFKIVRKLGFNVSTVKKHFCPNDITVGIYVNPIKKALYKLSDNMTLDNLTKLKKTLLTYEIDTTEYECCELILLELMCQKFITLNHVVKDKTNSECQLENLLKIVQNLTGLKKITNDLRQMQRDLNNEPNVSVPVASSTPTSSPLLVCENKEVNSHYAGGFDDLYQLLNQLNMEDVTIKDLKSDSKKLGEDVYSIKNPKRIGVCYIINQEEFHPSKTSIESGVSPQQLRNRLGSTKDKVVLEKTMSTLNFEVISHCNLGHKKMLNCIKDIIKYRVHYDDSIFMLCILSHGVRGHVYAADSVKVKIEDIQNMLDAEDACHLRGIPKVIILQACQVNDDLHTNLVADSPPAYHLRKSDFLIYWATAPEFEAYRDEKKGSIFIQILCYVIQKRSRHEHLYDIFTKVNDTVIKLCTRLEKDQVPIFKSTLRKKIYLQVPE